MADIETERFFVEAFRVVRMNAYGKSTLGPRFPDGIRPSYLRVVFGREDHECARHTGRARASDYGFKIAGKFLTGDVAVTVDQGA